jgi:phosphoserine phosphatase
MMAAQAEAGSAGRQPSRASLTARPREDTMPEDVTPARTSSAPPSRRDLIGAAAAAALALPAALGGCAAAATPGAAPSSGWGRARRVATGDPLPSWNDTAPRRALVAFVERVTSAGSPEFVTPPERIAVFDNDGTLWAEQPMYVQGLFLADRVRALAPQHPEWRTTEPFASLLRGDLAGAAAGGEQGLIRMLAATHTGMTTEEFSRLVSDWMATARHPATGARYTEMVYQPMLELLAYLRANGFKTFIVSGGGIEFMRPWTERVYGIPPEQVVGSTVELRLEMRDGTPVLTKRPAIERINDGDGKPVGIQSHIGRRPLAAFGNSDGDLSMLRWTTAGRGPRLAVIVHHTDGEREWAYDRTSHVGRLDRAWDEALARGWTVVSMRDDWKRIFPR